MEELVSVVAIVCLFVVLPWMFMRHVERGRQHRAATSQTPATPSRAASADLLQIAQRMEQRIDALEKILDTEAPGWRNRHHD